MIGLSLGERRGSHACSATTTLFSHPSERASKSRGTHLPRDLYGTFMATIFPLLASFICRSAGRSSVGRWAGGSVSRHSLPTSLPPSFPPTVPLFRPSVLPPVIRQSIGVLPPFVLSLSPERTHILFGRQAGRPSDVQRRRRRTCGRPTAGHRGAGGRGSRGRTSGGRAGAAGHGQTGAGDTTFLG